MLSLVALAFSGLGVALLYATWRSALPRAGRLLGWVSVTVGAFAWTAVTGTDRGIALALIFLCLSGLCFVGVSALLALSNARRKGQLMEKQRKRVSVGPGGFAAKNSATNEPLLGVGRRVGWFLLAGPVAAVVAFTVALASHQALLRLGFEAANALVAELFMFPVLWGCLAVWCLMASRLRRHSALMAALQCVAGSVLVVARL